MLLSDFHCKENDKKAFCQKLGDSQVGTIRKIQTAFDDDDMGVTQFKGWYNHFKDGRTSGDGESRSGWPSTSRNNQVIAKVNAGVIRDRRVTIREIAEEVDISTFCAYSILTEVMTMKGVAEKFMPNLLTAQRCKSKFMLKSHRTPQTVTLTL